MPQPKNLKMKNKRLKDLLRNRSSEKTMPESEINFLNQDEMNQIGGVDDPASAGPPCGNNSCGYYGSNAGGCSGTNSCSWNS
jgi:hypothetical protein